MTDPVSHEVRHTHLATRLEDGLTEYVVTCECGKSFSYSQRDTALHQQGQHRKVAELREQIEGRG